MAIKTKCQTPGASYHVEISDHFIKAEVVLPSYEMDITEEQAKLLEANIHNALELVLAPYFSHIK